jgi:hypothetical protein
MYTNTTSITVNAKALTYHVASGQYNVDTTSKTITGVLASFADNTIANNIISGAVRPAKITQFVIKGTDVVLANGIMDVDASVKNYLDANIAAVVNPSA